MAKPVTPHPYQIALDQVFKQQESGKDDVAHHLIYSGNLEGLRKWIHPDPKKLKPDQKVDEIARSRINKLIDEKKLHPLHLCVMLNRLEMVKLLVETRLCELNPKDCCDFTPLHHAAVGGFRPIIEYLLQQGADPTLLNDRGGTHSEILEIVHFKSDPSSQVCHYKRGKEIVQGDGRDFLRLTGTEAFLDKQATMSVMEAVRQWDLILTTRSQLRAPVLDMLKKAYDVFLTRRPQLYLEKREGVGLNVCAGEDIEAGSIVTEFLGEDESFKTSMTRTHLTTTYSYTPFEAEKKRGMAALINDSFPNCQVFEIPNFHGLLKRVVFFATVKIPKGSTLSYNYGVGEQVKFEQHQELCQEEMLAFLKPFSDLPSTGLAELFSQKMREVLDSGEKAPDPSSYNFFNKLGYIASTPHAILQVVCEQVLTLEALIPLCLAMERYVNIYAKRNVGMTPFLFCVKEFTDALGAMKPLQAQQWREKILEALPKMNLEELKALMKQARTKPKEEMQLPKTQKEIEWEAMVAKCIWKDSWKY